MIETYTDFYDEFGNPIDNRYILSINLGEVDEEGNFGSYACGSTPSYSNGQIITFIIDGNTRNQLEDLKLDLTDTLPRLVAKEGYKFKEYVETEKEKQIRLLKEQLKALEELDN